MQAVLQRHLNEPVAVACEGKKPVHCILLHCEHDYFTVDTHAGGWVHIPYSTVVSVAEFGDPRPVKTVQGKASTKLVVELPERKPDGGFLFGVVF